MPVDGDGADERNEVQDEGNQHCDEPSAAEARVMGRAHQQDQAVGKEQEHAHGVQHLREQGQDVAEFWDKAKVG